MRWGLERQIQQSKSHAERVVSRHVLRVYICSILSLIFGTVPRYRGTIGSHVCKKPNHFDPIGRG